MSLSKAFNLTLNGNYSQFPPLSQPLGRETGPQHFSSQGLSFILRPRAKPQLQLKTPANES